MGGIGHNRGPTMDRGAGWRRYAWRRARADLLPTLPIEVVRLRVRRARALGLDYKTYAGVRASTGRDLVAFLFSSNALRLRADATALPARAGLVENLRQCDRLVLVHPPQSAEAVQAQNACIDAAGPAPGLRHSWKEVRTHVGDILGKLPRDGVLVIGDTALEREWSVAGRLAGYLPSDRYFIA